MAKVMISMPDEVLRSIDQHARRTGTTRSGLLRALAERELAAARAERDRDLRRLLARPGSRGGGGTAAVRAARRSR